MTSTKKLHGWLISALEDRGFRRSDLARAWKVDDAVVSRFVASGKPDITIDRILVLAEMLGMASDELVKKLSTGAPRLMAPKPSQPPPGANVLDQGASIEGALAQAQEAVARVRELLPRAHIRFEIVFNNGEQH